MVLSNQKSIFMLSCSVLFNQATGYASPHCSVPVPSQDKWEGFGRKGFQCENVDDGGLLVHLPLLSFPAP